MCKRKWLQDSKQILHEDLEIVFHYQKTKQAILEKNVETLRDQLRVELNGIFLQNVCKYSLDVLEKEMIEVRYNMLQDEALQSYIAWLKNKLQDLS